MLAYALINKRLGNIELSAHGGHFKAGILLFRQRLPKRFAVFHKYLG